MQSGPSEERKDWDKMADEYKSAYDEARITKIDVAPLRKRLRSGLQVLGSKHRLEGLTIADTPPILLFTLPSQVPYSCLEHNKWGVWIWGWPGHFGASLTFKIMFYKFGDTGCRTWVPKSSPSFAMLRQGIFRVLFVRKGNILAGFDVDFSSSANAAAKYAEHWSNVDSHIPQFFDDDLAHFWEVLDSSGQYKPASNTDHLAVSWLHSFKISSKYTLQKIVEAQACAGDLHLLPGDAPPATIALYQLLSTPNLGLSEVMHLLQTKIYESGFINDFFTFQLSFKDPALSTIHDAAGQCLNLFLRSGTQTSQGSRLCWIDGKHLELRYLPIDTSNMSSEDVGDYWTRLPDPNFFINWGHLIKACDVPINPDELISSFQNLRLEAGVEQTLASADALLEEAAANKKWTIPPLAVVELEFGPFTQFEIAEINEEVAIVGRNRLDHFCITFIRPGTQKCSCGFVPPSDNADDIHAAGRLLFSAIIRDFWIVEEREKVFSTRTIRHRNRLIATSERPRIIYMPRIKYIHRPNLENCASELEQHERLKHFVSAHLRHAKQASAYQLILAERYGFNVPTGYTFVRPHERGKGQRELIYRSRSALGCLYTVGSTEPIARRTDWFAFERDVSDVMTLLGFKVQHVSSSKSGDNGVVLYATKGTDFDQINWIIQCKAYGPNHKVGPRIVRELIGALEGYPAGTRGMIVTTSSFTGGSMEAASQYGIRLIDGPEFADMLTNKRQNDNNYGAR